MIWLSVWLSNFFRISKIAKALHKFSQRGGLGGALQKIDHLRRKKQTRQRSLTCCKKGDDGYIDSQVHTCIHYITYITYIALHACITLHYIT